MVDEVTGALSARLSATDNRVTSVESTLESFIRSSEKQFDNLTHSVREGFAEMKNELHSDRIQASRPFPWVGVISLFLSGALIAGLLFAAVISPINNNQTQIIAAMALDDVRERNDAYEIGFNRGVDNTTTKWNELSFQIMGQSLARKSIEITELAEKTAALEATVEAQNARDNSFEKWMLGLSQRPKLSR